MCQNLKHEISRPGMSLKRTIVMESTAKVLKFSFTSLQIQCFQIVNWYVHCSSEMATCSSDGRFAREENYFIIIIIIIIIITAIYIAQNCLRATNALSGSSSIVTTYLIRFSSVQPISSSSDIMSVNSVFLQTIFLQMKDVQRWWHGL